MNEDNNTLQKIAEHLVLALSPLRDAVTDLESFQAFMHRIGWQIDSLPPEYTALAGRVSDLLTSLDNLSDGADLDEILDLIRSLSNLYADIKAITNTPGGISGGDVAKFLEELASSVFNLLIVEYLAEVLPRIYNFLLAVGVITIEDVDPTSTRPGFLSIQFRPDEIPRVLAEPDKIPRRIYGWGTDELDFDSLAGYLLEFFVALELDAYLESVDEELGEAFQDNIEETDDPVQTMLKVPLLLDNINDEEIELGIGLAGLPAEGPKPAGLILFPLVPSSVGYDFDITDEWKLSVNAQSDIAQQLGIIFRPDELEVRYPFSDGASLPNAGFGANIVYAPPSPTTLLGKSDRSRLEIAGGTVGLALEFINSQLEFRFSAEPHDLALVISQNDVDGFLKGLFGDGDLSIPVNLGFIWSNKTGFSFTGGAGFTISSYPHWELGPITVERFDLAVGSLFGDGDPPAINTSVGLAFTGLLGPVSFAVDGIGLKINFVFEDGNAGPFDINFGIKWPSQVGLGIDAGPVSGAGYLAMDPDKGEYAGFLTLKIHEFGLNAIGLLNTKDTDGNPLPVPGFSFLIIITAEFPPIQLGYGFTLNGAGGVAGIHRTMVIDALQTGLRDGSLGNILSPNIEDGPALISGIKSFFPVEVHSYVFGPIAFLGWSTPTLVHIKLGIIIKLPPPILLVLLGQLKVELPEEGETAIVSLRMDILGVIDFDKKQISLDASLRDSRIAAFTLSGDMAMRLNYGSNPNFALSVGGLNKNFKAPPGFPTLRRITVSLGYNDNPRVTLQGYFAITSNSFQFGARADLYAAAAGFNVKGWVGFDALIIFSPFSFRVDISAGFSLRKGSSRIAGIHVNATLTGPNPYHVWGEGCLSILFFDVCVGFDETFGNTRPQSALPAKDPWEELKPALEEPNNWSASLPPTVTPAVTFKPPPEDEGDLVLVHPMGNMTLRQKAVPLYRTLERLGEHSLGGASRYEISQVTIADNVVSWEKVYDKFAPRLVENLSKSEMISRDSFEDMVAGIEISSTDVDFGTPIISQVKYETKIIDRPWTVRSLLGDFLPSRIKQLAWTLLGAKSMSALWNTGIKKFYPPLGKQKGFTRANEDFVLASTDDLTMNEDFGTFYTKGEALQTLKYHEKSNPQAHEELQVISAHETREAA